MADLRNGVALLALLCNPTTSLCHLIALPRVAATCLFHDTRAPCSARTPAPPPARTPTSRLHSGPLCARTRPAHHLPSPHHVYASCLRARRIRHPRGCTCSSSPQPSRIATRSTYPSSGGALLSWDIGNPLARREQR
ncbi:hypothetical protein FIBSPDRAFT_854603 [Athelia psychrophila]|uniref:Secreted protein n=1 Tax=Athelia psychrophila TaxID=1759441 RepID=A0A166Q8G2_9AGAM|nr:hypothetical protein FIBSPDRAFT_854603 [Fibularhizoctonia sp. CBS 109695]